MVFTSTVFFFAFMPIAFLSYYLVPSRLRTLPIVLLSLFFYAWGEPRLVILIMVSAVINFTIGKALVHATSQRRALLVLGLALNLLPLVILKYTHFILMTLGQTQAANRVHLPLPIGVSFYTFMAMGYLIDIYRRRDDGCDHLLRFTAYLTMFPHLVAGPIVRWEHIGPQLRNPKFDGGLFSYGAVRVTTGLAKKTLIADPLSVTVDQLFALSSSPSTATAWLSMLLYSLQIYFDFSAYSDIAIGLAAMLGIRFHENFNFPYLATSASDFWRRWHISLGSWFRDYIYIPMGGSRVSRAKLWRNLMVVWALTGLWHGAAWTFIDWGLYYGILIGLERTVYGAALAKLPAFIQHGYGLIVAGVGWVLFRSTSLAQAQNIYSKLIPSGHAPLTDPWTSFSVHQNWVLIVVGCALAAGIARPIMQGLENTLTNGAATWTWPRALISALVLVALLVIATSFLVSVSYKPFIYFRF